MNKSHVLVKPLLVSLSIFTGACQIISPEPVVESTNKGFLLSNSEHFERNNEVVCIKLTDIVDQLTASTSDFIVTYDNTQIDSQVINCSSQGNELSLALSLDFTSNESKSVNVQWQSHAIKRENTKHNAIAELSVRTGGVLNDGKFTGGSYMPVSQYQLPKDHQVGNKLFKYEGIGWESQQIAYRYYFDHRGAIDVFGKQKPGLFLEKIGLDDGDYHALADWGMDVLKVGPSLGLGGIGAWHNHSLVGANTFSDLAAQVQSGVITASVELAYKDWQVGNIESDLYMRLQINANEALTHVHATSDSVKTAWVTGIVKHGVNKLTKVDDESTWNYIATWGKQSLNNDDLGMAIFFKSANFIDLAEDEYNHLVRLKPSSNGINYAFASQWAASSHGINSQASFVEYLEKTVKKLNHPIVVTSL